MSYSVWQSFITNGVSVIAGAVVSVFHEGSGAPAALFSSPSGGSIGSSVTSDSSGLARFYVAAGVYRITVTHASFAAEHRHVRIGEMAGVDDAPSDGKQYARKDGDWEEVSAYIPSLTVTVGTGGDYATWEAFYTAVSALRGGDLEVQFITTSHIAGYAVYSFPSWRTVKLTASGTQYFSTPLYLAGSNLSLSDLSLSCVEFKSDGVNFIDGINYITTTSGNIRISNASQAVIQYAAAPGYYTYFRNIGTFEGFGTIHGGVDGAGATLSGDNWITSNVSKGTIDVYDGSTTVGGTNYFNQTGALTTGFNVSRGARVNILGSIGCTGGTVTTLCRVSYGGRLQSAFTASGSYTNKFSQAPNIITKDGIIVTDATVATYSKKTSTLTSSSGVITIDCADGIDKHTLTLSENVTSWSFTNRPTGADYIVKIVAVTQDASTARTCVSPATKTAGSAWTVSSTLSSEEWLELWIGASDVYLRASGTMV